MCHLGVVQAILYRSRAFNRLADPEDVLDAMALESLWNMLTANAVGGAADGFWATLDSYARYAGMKLQG